MDPKYVLAVALVATLVVFVSGFVARQQILPSAAAYGVKDDSGATQETVSTVTHGINRFGIELLKQMEKNSNVFISPMSIEFALAIAAEGAKGQTFDEMVSVLHLPEDSSVRGPAFARLYNLLNREGNVTIELANALWLCPGFTPRNEYMSTVQRYYPADVYDTIDPARINAWVSERTHGKIDKIVNNLPINTVMVITNAIYFYGHWADEFDPKNTRKGVFHTPNGDKRVDMMHDRRDVLYYEDADAQAVLLPYEDPDFAMVIVLPKGDVEEYLDQFSADRFETILNAMKKEDTVLYIPKFEFKTDIIKMNGYLQNMGMRTAFTPAADFSGIWGKPGDLYIDQVLHRAYVRVDEKGTEAAAATAVVVVAASAVPRSLHEPKIFRADHPFLFFIVDRKSGAVLFAGKIVDPPAVKE